MRLKKPELTYYYFSYMASMFDTLDNYELAVEAYLAALITAKETNDESMIARANNNVGHSMLTIEQFAKAKPYIEHFYDYGIKNNNQRYIGIALNNFGEMALGETDFEQAKRYFEESLQTRLDNDFALESSWSYHNLGRLFLRLKNDSKAIEYLDQAVAIRQAQNRELESLRSEVERFKVYYALEQSAEMQPRLLEIIKLLETKKNLKILVEAYELRQKYLADTQDFRAALETAQLKQTLQRTILERKANIALVHYLAKIDYYNKELDNAALRKENELRQHRIDNKHEQMLLTLRLSLLIVLIVLYFARSLSNKNKKLNHTIATLARTRTELIEAEKMSALTTLVTGMSHQLNTPIGIMVTASSMAKQVIDKLQSQLADRTLSQTHLANGLTELSNSLLITERSCEKATNLIDQFKAISTVVESSEIRAFPIISKLNKQMASIQFRYPTVSEISISGDDEYIEHYQKVLFKVIEQLLQNSAEHPNPTESTCCVQMVVNVCDDRVRLTYTDNGTGIDKAIRQKIFEPFFTTKGMQQKVGLGLHIAYNAVKHLMKGSLQCCSNEGGAKFIIDIPKSVRAIENSERSQ